MGAEPGFERRFIDTCTAQGVAPLVHHRLRLAPTWNDWPETVREWLSHTARMHAAIEMLRERELAAVLTALAAAGVEALLLKGAALAHTHYPEPALRTRCDADVLITPGDHDAAIQVLEGLRYRHPNAVSGTLVSYEAAYCKRGGAVDHVVDLHWQINNGQVFARALGYDEAKARCLPVPPLGASARTLYPPHALLLACMHRAAHLGVDGPEANRLIWLYDIHLLAGAMTSEEWRDFAQLATTKAMRRISLDAFARTSEAFGTAFPPDVMRELESPAAAELSAAYLHPGRRRVFMAELRALGTWTQRATLLRESAFPPADYMHVKYGTRRRWLLPWWYLRRAVEGAWKISRS